MATGQFDLMLQALAGGKAGDPSVSPSIQAWLLYGKPLDNPAAIAFVKQYFPDLRVQIPPDRATLYRPGPVAGATGTIGVGQRQGAQAAGGYAAPAAPQATAPRPAQTSIGGEPGAPQSGLYQTYVANQQAAASRPIAENPIKGPNAGDNSTPVPPVTATTTPNATNPTAPSPTPPSSTGGGIMANPTVPGGGALSDIAGRSLVGANAQPDNQMREALRSAGYDPYAGGLGAQFLAKIIKPVLGAESSFYGVGQPGADYTQAGNFIANLVKQFTTPGVNAGASVQQFAQHLLGNPDVAKQIAATGDWSHQSQAYQNLAALANYDQSDLGQAAAGAQMDRLLGQYRDAATGLGGGPQFNGNFSQFIQNDPRGQALARLLGIGG